MCESKQNVELVGRKILSTNVKYLRFKKGWSQFKLSGKSDVSVDAISDIETMFRQPGLDNIEKIAYAFDLSIAELLTDHGYKVTKKRVDEKQ